MLQLVEKRLKIWLDNLVILFQDGYIRSSLLPSSNHVMFYIFQFLPHQPNVHIPILHVYTGLFAYTTPQ